MSHASKLTQKLIRKERKVVTQDPVVKPMMDNKDAEI